MQILIYYKLVCIVWCGVVVNEVFKRMAYYGIYIFKLDNLPDKGTTSRHAESPPPTMSPTGHSSYRIAQELAAWAVLDAIETAVSNTRSASFALR